MAGLRARQFLSGNGLAERWPFDGSSRSGMKPKKKLKVSSRIPLRKFRVSQNKMVKLVILVLCTLACTSQVFGESLESILARMDQSAPGFQGATAKLVLV